MSSNPATDRAAMPAPASVRSSSLDLGTNRSFLADVVIDHGPRELLGRLFLRADTAMRERGVRVSFGTYDELRAVNKANLDSWTPLLPIFDPSVSGLPEDKGIVLIGRDARGKAVFAQCCRLYELGQGTLKDEIESLRIFYKEPERLAAPGEAMICTAPIAARTRGKAAYNGGLWVHPDHRGRELVYATVQLSRGSIVATWGPDTIFSLMLEKVIAMGLARMARLNTDWEVSMVNTPTKRGATLRAGLVWISAQEQERHFADYLEAAGDSALGDAQVDREVVERATNQKIAG